MPPLFQKNIPLANLTWWKMGGPAELFIQPKTQFELEQALLWANQNQVATTVLGGGSNVLISDDGIAGLVISTRDWSGCDVKKTASRIIINAKSGTQKAEITKIFLKEKLAPALFLCGLPGDVGGGVVMNAGVGDPVVPREFVEIVDEFEAVQIINGHIKNQIFNKNDVCWTYRRCRGWQPGVISRVTFSWPLRPQPDVISKVKQATLSRRSRQPLDFPSCGSVFKNPEGHKAGRLIEQAGLKGFSIGSLQVSEKHANFIINKKSLGKARDAKKLILHIQTVVRDQFGIELEPEVQLLGRW